MRSLALVLCLSLLFGTAHSARAYWDDSIVIEIEGGLPPEPPPSTPSQGGTGTDTSVGSAGTGSTGTGESVGGVTQGSGGGTTGGGTTYVFSSGGTLATSSNDTSTVNDGLFDLLVAGGAITGGGAQGSGDAGQGAANSSVNNASGGAGGGVDVTVNAAKLRETLRGNFSFRQILEDFSAGVRGGTYRRGLSYQDVGLMAAASVLEDTSIDELTFGATRFEMLYRSRGYLLGFIPKTFPVRVAVDPQALTATGRVTLTLPWYRFFIRKLFSPSVLAREIDILVSADVRAPDDTSADVQARLFDTVSQELKKKVGTVDVNR